MTKNAYPRLLHAVPISKASTGRRLRLHLRPHGPWNLRSQGNVVFDADGRMISDGSGLEAITAFDEQVHRTSGFVEDRVGGGGASALPSVVDRQYWLSDACATSWRSTRIYKALFSPRSASAVGLSLALFMFLCKVEIKATV